MTAQQLETMKQVLELIKLSRENYGNDMYLTEAVDELETTLEQKEQEQEPVAKFHVEHRTNACSDICDTKGKVYATCAWHIDAGQRAERICNLLNIAPPQRKPLTRDDLWKLWCNAKAESEYMFWLEFARAIEAAHNIKGEA